eukprot:TRINITY_DN432_c4_g1_i1.p1 TRINITY_DN432_c4_g1~~TRINITY_DN432_c4_g1_i1.p1  ORF type:complete len:244 (+),score=56.02 TRINITY_DN432_c4_g1_i1:150-881(+)
MLNETESPEMEASEEVALDQEEKEEGASPVSSPQFSEEALAARQQKPDTASSLHTVEPPKDASEEFMHYFNLGKDDSFQDLIDADFARIARLPGRSPILLIFGRNYDKKSPEMNPDRIIAFLIRLLLKTAMSGNYGIVYFHSHVGRHHPPFKLMKRAHKVFVRDFKKNVEFLYVVHPTTTLKIMIGFSRPFISKKFWVKMRMLPFLSMLSVHVPLEGLNLPDCVCENDMDRLQKESLKQYQLP